MADIVSALAPPRNRVVHDRQWIVVGNPVDKVSNATFPPPLLSGEFLAFVGKRDLPATFEKP
jgi:hypothetical protein